MADEPEHIKEVIGRMEEAATDDIQDAGSLPVKKKTGGKLPGAGRPKGPRSLAKMTKAEAKERFISRVQQNVDTLFNAQLSLAKGEQHLFVKYHTGEGKDRRAHIDIVTDPETISQYLTDDGYALNKESGEDEYYFISTRPANNQAIDSLLNRAFGKAPEKIEIEGGLFKANQLKIEVVQPRVIEAEEAEIVNNESESTTSDDSSAESETTASA